VHLTDGGQLVQVRNCNEIGDRQREHVTVSTEFEWSTAVIRQQLLRTQQSERSEYVL
jgi:hypothetical protein